jgi:hypothetical protein
MSSVEVVLPSASEADEALASRSPRQPAIHWPRLFAEGAAIVVSILLAFALNAWWARVQAAEAETVILLGLQNDFEATVAELGRTRSGIERLRAACDTALHSTAPSTRVTSDEATRFLAELVSGGASYAPVEGTLNALLSSQGLGVISDPDLRSMLAGWSQHSSRIELNRQRVYRLYDDQVMPFLESRIPVRTLDALSSPKLGSRQSDFRFAPTSLYAELEFENLVNDVYYLESEVIEYLDLARTAADSILGMIRRDLPEGS